MASEASPAVLLARGARTLAQLVKHFDGDPARCRRMMRELLLADRQVFYAQALEILKTEEDSRGVQHLIVMLESGRIFLPVLTEPSLTLERAVALSRSAVKGGILLDVILARYLARRALTLRDATCPPDIQRFLDILAEIADGERVLPYLMSLARETNRNLQSKAVLIIGRMSHNVQWAQMLQSEPDGRVRANAIESLWGIDTEEARQVLRSSIHDENNRVVGNALIGLYRLGDCSAVPEVFRMASHASKRFRGTAVWVMGASADPRYTRVLGHMVGEQNSALRAKVFSALGRIKAAVSQARQAGAYRIAGRGASGEVRLDVRQESGVPATLPPTAFILLEGGQDITAYSVEPRTAPAALAITLLLPGAAEPQTSSWYEGARRALWWKRSSDLWAVAYHGPRGTIAAPADGSPELLKDPDAIGTALSAAPCASACEDLWSAIRRASRGEVRPGGPERHVLILSDTDSGRSDASEEAASFARAAGIAVHAITRSANESLEQLCQSTHGSYWVLDSEIPPADAVEAVWVGLLARFVIRYRPVSADAKDLKLIVNSPSGWGEARILLPSPAMA